MSNPLEEQLKSTPSRRRFLTMSLSATAAGLFARGMDVAAQTPAGMQNPTTPTAAVAELVAGNKRFVSGKTTAEEYDRAILRDHLILKQEPFAAVLSCADSRVPVEEIFDQTIGHIFVTRVAGNFVTPEIMGSLEYGAAVLGTKAILVLGHANCGAVNATIQAKDVPGQISVIYQHIQPAIKQSGTDLVAATKANAKAQATLLAETSTVIAALVKAEKIKVVAGYYDVGSGEVALLD
jgi:carbonic anhydrase